MAESGKRHSDLAKDSPTDQFAGTGRVCYVCKHKITADQPSQQVAVKAKSGMRRYAHTNKQHCALLRHTKG